jgi:hypothetical protein
VNVPGARDRARSTATFMRGETGYPFITYDYPSRSYEMPHGLSLVFRAHRRLYVTYGEAREMRDLPGVNGIVHSGDPFDIQNSVVLMPLDSYVRLLKTHIDTHVLVRERDGE